MKALRGIFLGIATLALVAVFSCSRGKDELSASGTIEATEVKVSSSVQGRLVETEATEGAVIAAGDALAKIDPEYYRLQAGLAKAGVELARAQLDLLERGARSEDLAQAEAALASADESLALARSDATRMRELEASGSATRRQREDAEARLSSATAAREAADQNLKKLQALARPEEIRAAEARVEQAKWNADIADKALADCEINAPVSGILTARLAEVGELAGAGTGIALISDLSRLSLKIYLPETEIGRISLGAKAEVSVDSFPGRIFPGEISYISPRAEFTPKNVQTKDERAKLVYAVKIELGDGEGALKPGMPADARFPE